MCHQCNKYCLQSAKTNTNGPRTCIVHFGTETKYRKQDTQGLPCTKSSKIFINKKGISHFRMKRMKSVISTTQQDATKGMEGELRHQTSTILFKSNCPDISEIEDVSRYVVSYTGKRHNMSQAEIDAIQNIIMK
jgi:hypothetical protein